MNRMSTWLRLALLTAMLAPAALAAQGTGNVRLTFQLIEADGFEGTDPSIADVVAELREVFRFEGYRLLDTSVLRGALMDDPGEPAVVSQRISLDEQGPLDIRALITRTQESGAIRVFVSLLAEGPGGAMNAALMDASVTVRGDQTVVLGSVRPNRASGALILVMTPHLDD